MISQTNLNKILRKYNLKANKILATQAGYRNKIIPIILNNQQKICLIIYKNDSDIVKKIRAANAVSDYLAQHHFPTRLSLKNSKHQNIIKLSTAKHQRYACVYNYLDGQTIAWESYSQKHLKLLGKVMAKLHQQLAKFNYQSHINFPKASKQLLALNLKTKNYFAQAGVAQALAKKLNLKIKNKIFAYQQLLLLKTETLAQIQALHLDFVRSNLLFTYKKQDKQQKKDTTNLIFRHKNLVLSGILDFEKTALGNPILDLARSLAFLLIDCKYKSEQKIKKYFLRSGYQKRGNGQLSKQQLSLLEPLVNFFLLYDFYKFLKHNPYQNLKKNKHFIGTKQYLLKQQYLVHCDL